MLGLFRSKIFSFLICMSDWLPCPVLAQQAGRCLVPVRMQMLPGGTGKVTGFIWRGIDVLVAPSALVNIPNYYANYA